MPSSSIPVEVRHEADEDIAALSTGHIEYPRPFLDPWSPLLAIRLLWLPFL